MLPGPSSRRGASGGGCESDSMGVIKAVPGICKKQILCYNGVRIQHIVAASRFLVSNNPLLKRIF
jgi:hypothetical protein